LNPEDLEPIKGYLRTEFQRCCQHLGISDDGEYAQNAVLEVYDAAKPYLRHAVVLAPFFPDHGELHVCRLAHSFADMLKTLGAPHDLNGRGVGFLVLVFSSLILHDVGMGAQPGVQNVQKERLIDYIRESRSHARHHAISLETIERQQFPAAQNSR